LKSFDVPAMPVKRGVVSWLKAAQKVEDK